ncbi:chemotaxis protein CheB [Saccharothrix syringae]|uniref:protein-glutamate methylesterase n=1 Tax=Saccharothrix syringae TaxID=103733 RepID=A0A5Q0H025_SACSY|nr:chemotaxis protein CheB [Saccharothrix syringae]QFZ19130.1 chemotaxis protein CheB [Saccharothrix syringae]
MPQAHADLIVVGASAGGVEALRDLVAGLPPDLPAAVAVVLHLPAGGTSALPQIIRRAGPLPAVSARSGMPLTRGRVHVAPPDHHLLVVEDRFVLSHGPAENGHRPAIDVLFRSAAIAGGPRVVGVILSGVLDDGVAGLVAIRTRGGTAVVQDPDDALYAGMPENALRHVETTHVRPAAELGPLLAGLVRDPVGVTAAPPVPARLAQENRIARDLRGVLEVDAHMIGEASEYSCPDCNGVLNEVEPDSLRFRCQIGHAWSAEALAQAQGDAFEKALWTALRTLEEKASLSHRMVETARGWGDQRRIDRYLGLAEESTRAATVLRDFLLSSLSRSRDESSDVESTGL